jgi:peptide deformylase
MALRKVAVLGHPVLLQVAKPVPAKEICSAEIQSLIQDMAQTMVEYDGRGLAAPQVHESLQIVVMIWDFDPNQKAWLRVLINPTISPLIQDTSAYWEGCLSIPGMRGKVVRPNRISVEAYNETGESEKFQAEGFAATVIQHECDHLIGKLYVDRMNDFTQFAFSREYQKYFVEEESTRADSE